MPGLWGVAVDTSVSEALGLEDLEISVSLVVILLSQVPKNGKVE